MSDVKNKNKKITRALLGMLAGLAADGQYVWSGLAHVNST